MPPFLRKIPVYNNNFPPFATTELN